MSDDRFFATHWAIEKFAKSLTNLVDDGQQAAQYAREHIFYNNASVWDGDPRIKGYGQAIPETGLLFSQAMNALKDLHHELGFNYQHLWQAAQASGAELALVAKYYRVTDHEIARRMDRLYGEKRTR